MENLDKNAFINKLKRIANQNKTVQKELNTQILLKIELMKILVLMIMLFSTFNIIVFNLKKYYRVRNNKH